MNDKNGSEGGDKAENLSSSATNIITSDIKPQQKKRRSRVETAVQIEEKEAGSSWIQRPSVSAAITSPSTQSTSSSSSSTSSIDSEALQKKISTSAGRVRLVESTEHDVRLRRDSQSTAMTLAASNLYTRRKSTLAFLESNSPMMSRKRSIRSHMSELEAMAAERRKLTTASLALRKSSRVTRSARIDLLSG